MNTYSSNRDAQFTTRVTYIMVVHLCQQFKYNGLIYRRMHYQIRHLDPLTCIHVSNDRTLSKHDPEQECVCLPLSL